MIQHKISMLDGMRNQPDMRFPVVPSVRSIHDSGYSWLCRFHWLVQHMVPLEVRKDETVPKLANIDFKLLISRFVLINQCYVKVLEWFLPISWDRIHLPGKSTFDPKAIPLKASTLPEGVGIHCRSSPVAATTIHPTCENMIVYNYYNYAFLLRSYSVLWWCNENVSDEKERELTVANSVVGSWDLVHCISWYW